MSQTAGVLIALAIGLAILATPFVAFIALARTSRQEEELRRVHSELSALRRWVRRLSEESPDASAAPEAAREQPEAGTSEGLDPGRRSARAPSSGAAYMRAAATPPTREGTEKGIDEEKGEPVEAGAVHGASSASEPASKPVFGARQGRDADSAPQPAKKGLAAARAAVDFETLIGSTWLLRIGLGILAIAFALFARSIVPQLSAPAKVALAYSTAIALFATGKVFESKLEKFARPVMAAGLSFGFFVAFASHFVPAMSAVSLTVSIGWMVLSMATVLLAAERWKSQATAALAILLGHVSALVSAGSADIYSLVMIAFLAFTAAVLVLRHTWVVLGLFAVAISYGSHLMWILAERDPMPADVGFLLNLVFLTSYYVAFLIADVLRWHRVERDDEKLPAAQFAAARQLGPANLVLYVSLASLVYFTTGAKLESIEWFYLTLGAAQGGLAWFYWGVRHRDFAFYPAFGTVLWTMGLFAGLDALGLNLVLASQALLLLVAGYHTRLWIFHALAQLALAVAFVHYLAYPPPAVSSWGFLLGGLGIAGVYLLKASLEEIWYGDGAPERWLEGVESDAGPSFLRESFATVFAAVAPYLAPLHAALGGLVLVRELLRHFGPGREVALALVAAHALLAVVVLVRRRDALLFAFTVVAVSAPYLAESRADSLATLLLLDGLVLSALGLAHIGGGRFGEAMAKEADKHAQAVVVLALLGAFFALRALSLGFEAYLPALSLPVLVLLFQEGRSRAAEKPRGPEGAQAGSTEAAVSALVCLAAAVAVVWLTVEAVGVVVAGPLWIVGWSVALVLASTWRRSGQLFAAGYGLLIVGYAGFLLPDEGVLGEVVNTLWIGAVVSVVPVALAMAMDRALHERLRADEPVYAVAEPMTYGVYGLGFLLLTALAHHQLPLGWSFAVPALLGLSLMVPAGRFRAERAVPVVVASLVALHAFVFVLMLIGGGIQALLIPVLVLCATTLGAERVLVPRSNDEGSQPMWRATRTALVVIASWTTMLAIYESTQFGTQWATVGWSVLGVVLMGVGFGLRSAVHRRVALVILGVCVLRVFVVDTQGLSDMTRTVAFFVLGLSLVGAAWLYTRFSEELRSWL